MKAQDAACVCGHSRRSHRGKLGRGTCEVTIWTYGPGGCGCSGFTDAVSPKGLAMLEVRRAKAACDIEADDEGLATTDQEPE